MATKGGIDLFLNQLPGELRRVFVELFQYVLPNIRLGGPQHQDRAENFPWIRYDSTTASTANEEWTITHTLGQAPRWILPVLPLDSTSAQIVRLKCPRAADAQRIYLSSPDTGAQITLMVEV